MRFRVKDYCRIILYLPSEDKLKSPYRPEKPKRLEENVDMHLSEDETPVETEDALPPASHHRPPSYNPEDYANALAKYSKASNLYTQEYKDKKGRCKDKNPKEGASEMTLKQFASLPELLRRLREDLKTAYLSFVKELVRDPHDGVSLLMDLLKMIQLAQSNLTGTGASREQQIALRRALIDEFECLSCLRCCLRCSDAATRLANYRSGLYALAASTMSSLTRSRTLALQLLTKASESSTLGHRQVLEAFSTLRLRFAEPVRCKFLISMMLSYPHPSFQLWGLKLLNSLLATSTSLRERIYLQEEMAEAGFDIGAIKKALEHRGVATKGQQEAVKVEVEKWVDGYIDLGALEEQLASLKSVNCSLRQELEHLRQANMKLLEENVLLKAVGGEVEERCMALKRRLEHHGIPTAPSPDPSVTDSEVSSFITTSRGTVRRNSVKEESTSDTKRMFVVPDTVQWNMVSRSSPDGQGPSRQLSRQTSSKITGLDKSPPPIPSKKYSPTNSAPEIPKRSVYINTFCDRGKEELNCSLLPDEENAKNCKTEPEEVTLNGRYGEEELESRDASSNTTQKSKKDDASSNATQKSKKDSNKDRKASRSSGSLSSSTSSLSPTSSTTSLNGGERKERKGEEPAYENLPRKEGERSEEGEIEYERDVVVYEAITMGNETILVDKEKNSSLGSSKKEFCKDSNVRKSINLYENIGKDQRKMNEGAVNKNLINSFVNGIKKRKKDKKGHEPQANQGKGDVTEEDIEAVMNGLENVIRSAESSSGSLVSVGTVKESAFLTEEIGHQSSPTRSSEEVETADIPPLPPRMRSSHKERRTPVPVIYLESPVESSDTETLKVPSMDTASTRSFGWFRADPQVRRRETLQHHRDLVEESQFSRRNILRRSESLHSSNIFEYNSHRSYSPRRRRSAELDPLEESEVRISGRTYTQYTAPEPVNNAMWDAKRRRNRSFDDRLDRWLEDDYKRQRRYEDDKIKFRPKPLKSGRTKFPQNEELTIFSRQKNAKCGLWKSDYGPNFMLNSPSHRRLEEVLSDLADFGSPTRRRSRSDGRLPRNMMLDENPSIPTPDYGNTPAGTLTNPGSSGRHILDMASGLY